MKSLSRALVRVAAAVVLVAVAGCAEQRSTPLSPEIDSPTTSPRLIMQPLGFGSLIAEAQIGPEGGVLYIPGGHTLEFPAGALDASTTITASRHANSISVDFGPEGLIFPEGSRPTLTYFYGSATVPPWVNPGSLKIIYIDGTYVEVLDTLIDLDARTVQAELQHFSTYALATD